MKPRTRYQAMLSRELRPGRQNGISVLELFSGAGGLGLGFEAAGFDITHAYEADIVPVQTYNANLRGTAHQLFLDESTKYPTADIVIGGPPCQPFSVIGQQQGRFDSRNGFPAFVHAIKTVKPEMFLIENVKGILYKNGDYIQGILQKLRRLGYHVQYNVLNAASFGVPQNRERFVAIGSRHPFTFECPESMVKVSVRDALGPLMKRAPSRAHYLTPSQDRYIAKYEQLSKCVTPRDLHSDSPARTLTCRNLAGATSDMHRIRLADGRRRRLLVEEAKLLQSFPLEFEFKGNEAQRFSQIGNAVPPLFAKSLAIQLKKALQ